MIPDVALLQQLDPGIPRESGDDPESSCEYLHSWGVFPARAGMIQNHRVSICTVGEYSPRERG